MTCTGGFICFPQTAGVSDRHLPLAARVAYPRCLCHALRTLLTPATHCGTLHCQVFASSRNLHQTQSDQVMGIAQAWDDTSSEAT
jgi:hypothetical protein